MSDLASQLPDYGGRDRYDAIVIGSGAGGAAAAYRLSARGLRVLILEKGTRLPRDGSTLEVEQVVTQARFLSAEQWIDGRGRPLIPEEHFNLGGKTKWYGAALLRFSAPEFAAEPDYAALGWPFAYSDFAPYYEEAEQLLGVRHFNCEPGLQRLLHRLHSADTGWQSSALPLALSERILEDPREASHFDGFASVRDFKGDAQVSLLDRIVRLPNVELRTDAAVVALLPAYGEADRIAGVRLGTGEELRARTVLLAAGALHSPRLLSRYLTESGLRTRLPGSALVGRHLKLHLLTAVVTVSGARHSDLLRKTMLTTHSAYVHSSAQPLGFGADLISTLIPRFVPRFLADFIAKRAYGFFLQTEDGSHAGNRVAAAEPGDAPGRVRRDLFDYDAARTPASLAEHRAFVRAFQRSLLGAGLPSFGRRIGIHGTAHACGTLVTGADPRDAVVDPFGRVFGLEGLYVVDGSVLPRSSRVNPALSIYAWGLGVGSLLADALHGESGPVAAAGALG